MSNIINKVKDALTGHDHTTDTSHESAGTTHRAGHTGVGTTTDTSATGRTAGPHRSDVANKVDPRVDSDRDGSRQIGTTGTTGKTAGVGGYGSHHGTTTYGPHSTNVGNKLDPTVDSDLSGTHRATGGGAYTSGGLGTTGFGSGATGLGSGSTGLGSGTYHTTTTGPHSSDLLNKADPRVDSDRDGSRNMGAATYGPGATTHGTTHSTGYSGSTHVAPHDSNIANKLDPRVDSDRDGSRNMGMRETTAGTGTHYGTTGTTGLGSTGLGSTGAHYGTGYSSTNAGPHDSNVANKLDPRVDSDRDHRATHAGGVTSIGVPGSHHTSAGPHSSDIANKVDPRVDSDRDHRAAGTTGTYGRSGGILGTGTGTGDYTTSTTHQTSTTYGPHSTNTANKLDPRVDSDHDRRTAAGSTIAGTTYGTTHGTSHGTGHGTSYGTTTAGTTHGAGHTGPAPHTAGPHKSDMMNKLDPRVDSDLDGSKTMGGNKTFASPGSHHA